ncbi:MAG: ribonuclease Y [Oscillospiraceae bacterium]
MPEMTIIGTLVPVLISGVVIGLLAFNFGVSHRKKTSEKMIGSAELEAEKIIKDAKKIAETSKKESLIEAKDEVFKLKTQTDKEIRERNTELTEKEKRLLKKDENLDRKIDQLESKEILFKEKTKEIETKFEEIETIKLKQLEVLEKLSGYTKEAAKAYLLNNLEEELIHEKAVKINAFNQNYKEEVDFLAKKMLSEVISRCASDHVSEATVSVVTLPNDEMKGRIIGREGRNIRTIETLTGVDLIIDDTPEAITISSFDPVRREIARVSLERLITDGRIHPSRIEDTVKKSTKDIESIMKQEGERAVMETGIHAIHPDLVKLIGRLKYRRSYGQNILNHSLEVAHLSGLLANELGADPILARRAGLLHDIGKAIDHEVEGTHVSIGLDIAKKYKEHFEVIHAIETHHGEVETSTLISCIVKAADAISAARPGARREDLANYIKRLERLEDIANSFEGVERSFAIQAGREIRILVNPEFMDDDRMIIVSREIVKKIEAELNYPGQIKVQLIRESRSIEFAK